MKITWTSRGRKRFTAISNYIAEEFYADYASVKHVLQDVLSPRQL